MKKNTLNNMILENVRGTQAYQAVITDLALEGVVPIGVAESLLGYEIPEYLRSPSGKTVQKGAKSETEEAAPKKEQAKQAKSSAAKEQS